MSLPSWKWSKKVTFNGWSACEDKTVMSNLIYVICSKAYMVTCDACPLKIEKC